MLYYNCSEIASNNTVTDELHVILVSLRPNVSSTSSKVMVKLDVLLPARPISDIKSRNPQTVLFSCICNVSQACIKKDAVELLKLNQDTEETEKHKRNSRTSYKLTPRKKLYLTNSKISAISSGSVVY